MLIVVIYHCILFWKGAWFTGNPVYESKLLDILATWMNSFHIYGFTLVSGYLFHYLKCEKTKYDRFVPFVINKFKRLLVPYVFVSLVWAIPFAVYYFDYSVRDIIIRFGFGVSPNQLWFLLMLFWIFVIFYPLSDYFKKNNIGGAIVVIIFYGIGLVGQMVLPNIFQVFRACTYISLFWLGFKIRQYGSRVLRKTPVLVWLVADVLLFAITQYLSSFDGSIFKLIDLGLEFVLHIVGALMSFVILQKLADHLKWKGSKIFSLFSRNSMPVYLLHQQIVYVLISLLNGKINPYIHAGINFLGAMIISLLIATFLMKFRYTRFLIGEK